MTVGTGLSNSNSLINDTLPTQSVGNIYLLVCLCVGLFIYYVFVLFINCSPTKLLGE